MGIACLSSVNYYPHHIGDYAKDTAHLSMLEDAAYRRMLDVYYGTEKPLPADSMKVCRLVRARSLAERKAVDAVLTEFFVLEADGWRNKRADIEIVQAQSKAEKARASAALSWQSRRNANAMRTHTEGNAPNNQEPIANNQKEKNEVGQEPPDAAQQEGKNGHHYLAEARSVLTFLNEKTGRNYEPLKVNLELIVARMKEGATVIDMRQVIAKKCREWQGDEKMAQYLRPATLFNRTKFAQYKGELINVEG